MKGKLRYIGILVLKVNITDLNLANTGFVDPSAGIAGT